MLTVNPHGEAMTASVLIARPGARAHALVQALASKGYACQQLDIMRLQPLEPTAAQVSECLVQPPDGLICISPTAAQRWLAVARAHLGAAMATWHHTVQLAATGASTAEVLHTALGQAPWVPERSSAYSASEALLALPVFQSVRSQHIVLASGEGGRQLLKDTLTERGARVTTLPLYRRCLQAPDAAAAMVLSQGLFSALIVTSAEQLDYLSSWYSKATIQRPLVVSSTRLSACASEYGFNCVQVADDATPHALANATVAVMARQSSWQG